MSCAVSSNRFSIRMPAWRKEHEKLSAKGDCAVFLHDVAGIRMNMKDGELLDHPTEPPRRAGVLAPPFVRAAASSVVQHGSVRKSPPLILGLTFVTSAIPSLLVFVEQSEHPTSSAAPLCTSAAAERGGWLCHPYRASVLARG
jgi:hypothetical protein